MEFALSVAGLEHFQRSKIYFVAGSSKPTQHISRQEMVKNMLFFLDFSLE